jgi:hypothetical protein
LVRFNVTSILAVVTLKRSGRAVAGNVGNLESNWRNADSECLRHLEGTCLAVEKHIEITGSITHQHDIGPAVGVLI